MESLCKMESNSAIYKGSSAGGLKGAQKKEDGQTWIGGRRVGRQSAEEMTSGEGAICRQKNGGPVRKILDGGGGVMVGKWSETSISKGVCRRLGASLDFARRPVLQVTSEAYGEERVGEWKC